ncbi:FMN-binding glutamate synthase family protein [Paradesulfitobacterium aromaticivorans]
MLGEGLLKDLMGAFLERMREVESVKGPYVVHGFSMLKIGAIGERAKHGLPVMEPYGSSRKLPTFEDLFFLPAMIATLPVDPKQVNTQVVIGKNTNRPLKLSTPIMPSAMAYGLSITREAKIAWAKGAALQDTACNSGDAGFYPEEREHAKYYIVQFNRARYGNSDEQLKQADAIEIRFGQSAMGALAETVDGADMTEELALQLGVQPGQSASRPLLHPEFNEGKTLKDIVVKVRTINPDVPVGVKIAAGHIEADLDKIIEAECDFVTIDGAGGGTADSPEVTLNNLGVPLVYAIPRADSHLRARGVRDKISLIATGGLRDAGDFLKVMALGADALYSGEAALVAMVYSQLHKAPPGTSPAELYLSWGKHGNMLDIKESAQALSNFIKASTSEMALLTGAIGKNDIKQVTKDDLTALKEEISQGTGVKLAY